MKRTRISILTLSALLFAAASCTSFDDSSLWKQVDEAQKQLQELSSSLEALKGQVGLLSASQSGGVITSITTGSDGSVTIAYSTAGGASTGTAVIAAASQIQNPDIIGTATENGVLYWTLTSGGKTTVLTDKDGAKIPVAGRTPSFTTDKDGYWMVNGDYVLDSKGEKVKSSGHSASLISSAAKNSDGTVTLTLADGSTFTVATQESFCLRILWGGAEVSGEQKVEDGVTSLEYTYSLTGASLEEAAVNVTTAENLEASVNSATSTVSVKVPADFRKGKFTLMATDPAGHFATRTVHLRGTFSVETENDLWKTSESCLLAPGCYYYAMEFKTLARKMKVLEVDLTNPSIELATATADDKMPNPNGNRNSNNGFNLRETLSQLCARKTSAGESVIAGVNTGFFDSNDGILRGAHIENGEILYMNSPEVVKNLANHAWSFTIYKDNTASCGKKTFTGALKALDKEYMYYSVNDTILRGGSSAMRKSYPLNIYTSRYVKTPHAEAPSITNPLADRALYVVAQYTGENMTVNTGWAEASVTAVYDGRTTPLSEAPYLTDTKAVAIQAWGSVADALSALKAGDKISLKAEMEVEGETLRPILIQNSTMWHYVTDGENTLYTVPSGHDFRKLTDPMTFVCIDKTKSRIMLVQIDGRSAESTGVTAAEVTEIALRLGAWNSTRFDGGGSSAMWALKGGVSGLVSTPSDSKGERSCMSYIYLKKK